MALIVENDLEHIDGVGEPGVHEEQAVGDLERPEHRLEQVVKLRVFPVDIRGGVQQVGEEVYLHAQAQQVSRQLPHLGDRRSSEIAPDLLRQFSDALEHARGLDLHVVHLEAFDHAAGEGDLVGRAVLQVVRQDDAVFGRQVGDRAKAKVEVLDAVVRGAGGELGRRGGEGGEGGGEAQELLLLLDGKVPEDDFAGGEEEEVLDAVAFVLVLGGLGEEPVVQVVDGQGDRRRLGFRATQRDVERFQRFQFSL